ncbi:MAG: HAD family hydrolase [Clostridia bacterium]
MYKFIIFDVDGTLLDTCITNRLSLQRLLEEETGIRHSEDFIDSFFGLPAKEVLDNFLVPCKENAGNKWQLYNREYEGEYTKLFPQIKELLQSLKAMGVIMGLATSRKRTSIMRDLDKFQLTEFFGVYVCAEDTELHKPLPEPLLLAIEKMGAQKEQTLFVGDSIYDSQCAAAAEVDFALAKWGANELVQIPNLYCLIKPLKLLDLY